MIVRKVSLVTNVSMVTKGTVNFDNAHKCERGLNAKMAVN